jgi:hypothetical protein
LLEALHIKYHSPSLNSGLKARKELNLFHNITPTYYHTPPRGAGRTEKRRGQNFEKGTFLFFVEDLVGVSGRILPWKMFKSRVFEMPFHAFWADI